MWCGFRVHSALFPSVDVDFTLESGVRAVSRAEEELGHARSIASCTTPLPSRKTRYQTGNVSVRTPLVKLLPSSYFTINVSSPSSPCFFVVVCFVLFLFLLLLFF